VGNGQPPGPPEIMGPSSMDAGCAGAQPSGSGGQKHPHRIPSCSFAPFVVNTAASSGGRTSWLALTHKFCLPSGPRGRDRIAQGTARNEQRPGFQFTMAKALKGRDNGSPALAARMRNFTLPRPADARGSLRPGLSRPGPLGLGDSCELWIPTCGLWPGRSATLQTGRGAPPLLRHRVRTFCLWAPAF
jgi:hypothetical protein